MEELRSGSHLNTIMSRRTLSLVEETPITITPLGQQSLAAIVRLFPAAGMWMAKLNT